MDYTEEELIAALRAADTDARTSQDPEVSINAAQAVDELTQMLDSLQQDKPVEGYDPAAFTAPEQYRQSFGQMRETVEDFPKFISELGQEFDDPANPEKVFAAAASSRGALGTGLDLLGQGAKLSLMEVSKFVPDSIEKTVVDNVTPVAKAIADSAIGDIAKWTYGEYIDWKSENPRKGRALEGVVNLAEVFAPPLTRKPVTDTSFIRTLADEQYARAVHLETGQRRDFLNTVIEPISTAANDLKRAERLEQNEKGRNVYIPTDDEVEMVNVLKGIESINEKTSFVKIRQVLEEQVETTHNSLTKLLNKSKFKFNKKELIDDLEARIKIDLDENPVLIGDAKSVATKIYNKAIRLLKEADSSPAGVMEVRRQLDTWAKKSGKDSYDGNENAWTVSQRSVRDFLNERVADAVPETPVLEKLRRQHLLLRSKDRVLPKAAKEAETRLGRQFQNVGKVTDTTLPKTPLGKVATVTTAATILGGSTFMGWLPGLSVLAATGTLGYAAYRGSISPSLRKTLSASLRQVDNVLAKTSLNKEMREAIQADRAAIVELMQLPTAPEGVDDGGEDTNE
jgi:hypothetical protein